MAILFLGACSTLSAQYGGILHEAAAQPQLSVGSAILLAGVASGSIRPELDAGRARQALAKLGVKLPGGADDSPISWGWYCYLNTQLFDLPASAGYGLFPGPRAAFHQISSRGMVPQGVQAGDTVAGPDALLLLRRIVDEIGGAR